MDICRIESSPKQVTLSLPIVNNSGRAQRCFLVGSPVGRDVERCEKITDEAGRGNEASGSQDRNTKPTRLRLSSCLKLVSIIREPRPIADIDVFAIL